MTHSTYHSEIFCILALFTDFHEWVMTIIMYSNKLEYKCIMYTSIYCQSIIYIYRMLWILHSLDACNRVSTRCRDICTEFIVEQLRERLEWNEQILWASWSTYMPNYGSRIRVLCGQHEGYKKKELDFSCSTFILVIFQSSKWNFLFYT